MSFLVIANGSKPKAVELLHELQRTQPKELDTNYFTTLRKGHACETLAQDGHLYQTVICIGGDGTAHECLNGVMQLPKERRPALLLIPRGTGNDFARLFVPPHSIWKAAQHAPRQWVDVMEVKNEKGDIRYCGNIGDAGLGAAVVENADKLPASLKGSARFATAILQTLLVYRKQKMQITTDDSSIEKRFLTIAFAKGKFFGSGIGISPNSAMDDGLVHITLIGEVNLLQYLRYLPQLKKAKKIVHPEVSYTTAKNVQITGTGSVELDGELVFQLPIALNIVPKAICWIGELR